MLVSLTALAFLILGTFGLATAIARCLRSRMRYRSWLRVTGSVVGFGYVPGPNRPAAASYEFTGPDGVVRQGRTALAVNPRHRPIGSPIAILVDPAAPQRYLADGFCDRYAQELLLGIPSALLVAAGLLIAAIGRMYS